MNHEKFSPREIPNRQTAIVCHQSLQHDKASIVSIGTFYLSMINRDLWQSQTAMARDMGVSIFQLSRSIGAARLPESVTGLFAGKKLSFRDVANLRRIVDEYGEAEVLKRCKGVPSDASTTEIFSLLTADRKATGVKISVVKGQKYLRVDVPNFSEIELRIKELEQMLNLLLAAGGSGRWGDRAELRRQVAEPESDS
jgi:hypothetical protein